MSPIETQHQEVTAQEAKLVGDEEVYADAYKVEPEVNSEGVVAQVAGTPDAPAKNVPVLEVAVKTDEVITDTSDPRAVQIPDAGRGFLDLPIHRLSEPTPEEKFASGDADSEVNEDTVAASAAGDYGDDS
jgi:hypothetical protein